MAVVYTDYNLYFFRLNYYVVCDLHSNVSVQSYFFNFVS